MFDYCLLSIQIPFEIFTFQLGLRDFIFLLKQFLVQLLSFELCFLYLFDLCIMGFLQVLKQICLGSKLCLQFLYFCFCVIELFVNLAHFFSHLRHSRQIWSGLIEE
ncbi:hypothetical protein V8G54_001197 [Vigna mungo]|uniref:Uncharacterized protein n=1 Tax=Vigna mungo TaxID=3915 RepID=A0AAQ3SAS5_VIGMU